LGEEAGAAAGFHFGGETVHGLWRDVAAFASGEGGAGVVEGREELDAAALAVFPECEGFAYGIFLALEATGLYSAASQSFLIGGEADFHGLRVRFGGVGFKDEVASLVGMIDGRAVDYARSNGGVSADTSDRLGIDSFGVD
jgi:hypothetical protein